MCESESRLTWQHLTTSDIRHRLAQHPIKACMATADLWPTHPQLCPGEGLGEHSLTAMFSTAPSSYAGTRRVLAQVFSVNRQVGQNPQTALTDTRAGHTCMERAGAGTPMLAYHSAPKPSPTEQFQSSAGCFKGSTSAIALAVCKLFTWPSLAPTQTRVPPVPVPAG